MIVKWKYQRKVDALGLGKGYDGGFFQTKLYCRTCLYNS